MNIWWALAFCVVVIVGPFATLRQFNRYREARRAREAAPDATTSAPHVAGTSDEAGDDEDRNRG